jgi:hypothetical protein
MKVNDSGKHSSLLQKATITTLKSFKVQLLKASQFAVFEMLNKALILQKEP